MIRYFKSKEFWLTLLGLMVLGAILFAVLFYVFLPSYTKHGQSVIVPTVLEKNIEEAEGEFDKLGLRFEVADSIYISNLEAGAIISQDPKAMSKVKPGRKIYLTVNKAVPPLVKIPEIFNVSTYQAKLLLDGAGLRIKKITYIPDEFKNLVRYGEHKGKRISAGDTLPKFSEIQLFVGKGLGTQRIETPDLVGLHYEEAISKIHKEGLNIGPIRFEPQSTEAKGTVTKQSPRYNGDSIVLGSNMTLFIAGPEPEEGIEEMRFESSDEEESDSTETKSDDEEPDGE